MQIRIPDLVAKWHTCKDEIKSLQHSWDQKFRYALMPWWHRRIKHIPPSRNSQWISTCRSERRRFDMCSTEQHGLAMIMSFLSLAACLIARSEAFSSRRSSLSSSKMRRCLLLFISTILNSISAIRQWITSAGRSTESGNQAMCDPTTS